MESAFYARRLSEHGWPEPSLVNERMWEVIAFPVLPEGAEGSALAVWRNQGGLFKYNLWSPRPERLATTHLLNQLIHAAEFSHSTHQPRGVDRVYSLLFASDHYSPSLIYEIPLWELTGLFSQIAQTSAERAFLFRWKWDPEHSLQRMPTRSA